MARSKAVLTQRRFGFGCRLDRGFGRDFRKMVKAGWVSGFSSEVVRRDSRASEAASVLDAGGGVASGTRVIVGRGEAVSSNRCSRSRRRGPLQGD